MSEVDLPDGANHRLTIQPLSQKYFAVLFTQITCMVSLSRLTRGAYRDRHGRWVRDAMDAGGAADESADLRTAKPRGPDVPTLASS